MKVILSNCRIFALPGMAASTLLSLMSCGIESECENNIIGEFASPDGSKRIVLFSRDCGATTGFNTQAMLLKSGETLPDEAGNVFIIDQGSATVSWKDDSTVIVTFSGGPRKSKTEAEVGGIRFEYP